MDSLAGLKAQLAPLETSLLESARQEAEERLAAARGEAASKIGEGEAQARDRLEKARAEGARAAEREAQRRLVHAKREARRMVLHAQREAYEHLMTSAVGAARQLRRHAKYPDLEERLVRLAKDLLGADAEIQRDPEGRGGVRARKGSRSVDLSLPALARRCVEERTESVSSLWS
jgi:vacuolar-type H+-ATPase subunit E/Vma4